MAGDDQNSDNQLFGEHLDPPEPLELSLEPDLGYPPPDPLFKTTVGPLGTIWGWGLRFACYGHTTSHLTEKILQCPCSQSMLAESNCFVNSHCSYIGVSSWYHSIYQLSNVKFLADINQTYHLYSYIILDLQGPSGSIGHSRRSSQMVWSKKVKRVLNAISNSCMR